MKPKRHQIADGIEMWLGDSRDVLPLLGQVDHIFMDPPYEQHMHTAKRRQKIRRTKRRIRKDGGADPLPVDFASIDGLREVLVEPMVAMCEGWMLAFCTPEGIAPWRDAIEAADGRYKRACFWDKPDAAPQFNGQGPAMGVECFVTAWCGPGFSRWNGGGRRNIFQHITNQPDRDGTHPTEKPVPLFAELLMLFSDAGQVILDPFAGSGTTGVACVRTGRQFIGIENNPEYFALAVKRISGALAQADMFIEIPRLKKQAPML